MRKGLPTNRGSTYIFERCNRTHSSRSSVILSPIWNLQRLHTYFDYRIILRGVCVRSSDIIRICLDFNSIFLFPISTNIMTWTWTTSFINHIKCNPWNGIYIGCGRRKFGTGTRRNIFPYLVCANRQRRRRRRRSNKFLFWYLFIFYRSCIWTVFGFFFPVFYLFTYLFKKYFIVCALYRWHAGTGMIWPRVEVCEWNLLACYLMANVHRFYCSQAIRWATHDIYAIINCGHIFITEYIFRTLFQTIL